VDEPKVEGLFWDLLASWDRRDAEGYASGFAAEGLVVGFDGSEMPGREEIYLELRRIFGSHATGRMVGFVREVRFLKPDLALLRAVASTVPAGKSDIEPSTNMIVTLVAMRQDGEWSIASFQATPAQFHGRPELSRALTEELRRTIGG
jgi:uncharacterized protein (TIGR02246 family)